MNTAKYKQGIRCLMNAVGIDNPAVISLMGNAKRLYKVLRLCGYQWKPTTKHWVFVDR